MRRQRGGGIDLGRRADDEQHVAIARRASSARASASSGSVSSNQTTSGRRNAPQSAQRGASRGLESSQCATSVPSREHFTRGMLPCSSTTLRLPARLVQAVDVLRDEREVGNDAARARRARDGPALGATRPTSSRRHRVPVPHELRIARERLRRGELQRIELRPQSRSAHRETSARRIRRRCRRRSAPRRARLRRRPISAAGIAGAAVGTGSMAMRLLRRHATTPGAGRARLARVQRPRPPRIACYTRLVSRRPFSNRLPARTHVRQHARHALLRHLVRRIARSRRSAASSTAARRASTLARADIQRELDRRKPGTSRHVTQRRESDTVEILSGVFEGRTTGTPIALADPQRGPAQQGLRDDRRHVSPRPRRLHVLAEVRHPRLSRRRPRVGARDRGARRRRRDRAKVAAPSATASRSAAIWSSSARTRFRSRIGTHVDANPFFVANAAIVPELEAFMDALRKSGDSCGAKITVIASGVPVGWGEPVYGTPRRRPRARR